MSSTVLKLSACLFMLIDHITCLFVPAFSGGWYFGRAVGRLAFPIFCFLLAEGYVRTRSRKKYAIRLAVSALLSEIPFDLCFNGFLDGTDHFLDSQNVMFTLLLGFLLLWVYDNLYQKYRFSPLQFNLNAVISILAFSMAAILISSDYSYIGILFILVFYVFRGKKLPLFLGILAVNVFFCNKLELFSLLSFGLIWLYRREKDSCVYEKETKDQRRKRITRYLFYLFYPGHLLLLWGFQSFM